MKSGSTNKQNTLSTPSVRHTDARIEPRDLLENSSDGAAEEGNGEGRREEGEGRLSPTRSDE